MSDFPIRRTRSGFEQIESVCNACKWTRERERYNGLSPEEKREYGKRVNLRTRLRRHRQLHVIEHQRHVLEKREQQITKQEEKLAAVRDKYRMPRGTAGAGYGKEPIAVDIVPFRMWLLRQHRLRNYETQALADEMGQNINRVERWLQGYNWDGVGRDPVPVRAINIDTLDAIAVALGDPGLLERMYPLEVE